MKIEKLNDIISGVVDIAREAGSKILEIYEDIDNFQVEIKGDNSPLTRADKEANGIICVGLEKLDTLFPIISEENKLYPYDDRQYFEYCWMVDPLDGTKEFIKRNGEFTVNIALIKNGKSVAGVVYTPVTDDMYYAIEGEGAFLIKDGKKSKLSSPTYTSKDEGLSIVCSRSHLNEETQNFIDAYKNPEKVAKGSSLKFLIIASGQAHVYPRLAPTMEWDTAAAQIILEESGGSVIDAHTNEPVRYNKENLLNPHFIAFGNRVD